MKGSKWFFDFGVICDSNGRWYFIIEWVKVMMLFYVCGFVVMLYLFLLVVVFENIVFNDLGNLEDVNYLRRELE